MSLKKCKHCNEDIAKSAKVCPKCGGKLGMPGWLKLLIVFGVIIVLMVACANACSNAVEETKKGYQDVNGKTSFKLNETFENKYEKVTMVEVNTNFTEYSEYFGPADGYKFVIVKFEVENINDENDELYVSSLEFSAFADDQAVEQKIITNDNYKDLSATLGKGKKTIGYIMYEVPIDAQKIIIDYNASFWLDDTSIEFVVQ